MISESQKAPKRYVFLRIDDLGNQKMKIWEAKKLPNVTYTMVSVMLEAKQLANVTHTMVLVIWGTQKAAKCYPKQLPNLTHRMISVILEIADVLKPTK